MYVMDRQPSNKAFGTLILYQLLRELAHGKGTILPRGKHNYCCTDKQKSYRRQNVRYELIEILPICCKYTIRSLAPNQALHAPSYYSYSMLFLVSRLFGSVAKSCMQKQPQTVGGGATQTGGLMTEH